jgi:hypothetical protein
MKKILLFALMLLIFNAGYSQGGVGNAPLDYIVILLMSIGVSLLIFHVISARQAYKDEAEKEPPVPPVHIINHFHVTGGCAHSGSTAVNDRSSRSYNTEEDNSNNSEVTNSNGGNLDNNMYMAPHTQKSELSDYEEGEDDENMHSKCYEDNIDEVEETEKSVETEQK